SCWVHYDAAVPHMHYNFVPVVYDEEQKQERINASKCIPYGTLGQFHWDMKDYLDRAMGFSVNVAVNAVRGEGDLTVLQLKIRTLKKEVGELEEKRDELLRAMEHCEEVSEINARQSEEGMILSRDDYESLLQAAKAYELYKPLLSEISSREKLSESLLADSMKDVSLAYELFGISQRRLFRELERKESELQVREVLEQSLKRELASSEEFLTDLRSSLTIDGDISYKQRLYNLMDILSGRNESLAQTVSGLGSLSEELLSQQRQQLLSSFDREYEKLLTENSSLRAQNDILSELKSILTESGEDGSSGTLGDMSGYTDKAVSELEELLEEERRQYREIFEEEEPLSQREVIRI
ncbi:MAG: hypothetical protein J5822_01930, partial [Eubacteriaceae bacterium]|nr:hypothetical protein [Eubacteriaceae bacterium]